MARYWGDYKPSATFSRRFNTQSSGTPTSMAGSPALIAYKDASTTGSTSGLSLSADHGAVVGMHNITVDLSADTTFYSTGSSFSVCFTAGTVGGTTIVGVEVASFTIGMQTVPMQYGVGAIPALGIVEGGTAQSAASNSFTLRAANTLEADVIVGASVLITSATTGAGQTALISDFNASTEVALLDNGWSGGITPTGTITYILFATAPSATGAVTDSSVAAAVLAAVVEGSTTVAQSLRLANAALGGKASGLTGSTANYRDLADSKARISATVDGDGNRTAVTLDLT